MTIHEGPGIAPGPFVYLLRGGRRAEWLPGYRYLAILDRFGRLLTELPIGDPYCAEPATLDELETAIDRYCAG